MESLQNIYMLMFRFIEIEVHKNHQIPNKIQDALYHYSMGVQINTNEPIYITIVFHWLIDIISKNKH